jgi:hypothetical protein
MENINILSDIRTFIEKNATSALPPFKFEFIPYVSELDNKLNNGNYAKIPKEIQNNVKQFISNVFYVEPPETEVFIYGYINITKLLSLIHSIRGYITKLKQLLI